MRWLVFVAAVALCLASASAIGQDTVSNVAAVESDLDALLVELNSHTQDQARTVRDHLEGTEDPNEAIRGVLASKSLDEAMQAMYRADDKNKTANKSESPAPFPENGLVGTDPVTQNSGQSWESVVSQLKRVADKHLRRHHQHPSKQYAAEYKAAVMNAHAAELAAALKQVAAAKASQDRYSQARSFSRAADQISELVKREQQQSSAMPLESVPIVPKSSRSSSSSSSGSSSRSGSGSGSSSFSGSESLQQLQDRLLNLLAKRAFATPEEQEDIDLEVRKLVIRVMQLKGAKPPVNHHLDLLFRLVKKVRNSFDGLRTLNQTEVEDLAVQVRAFLMLVEKRQGELLDAKDQAAFCGKRVQDHCVEQRNRCVSACVVKRAVSGSQAVETIKCPWNAYKRCKTAFTSCAQKQATVCGVLGSSSQSGSSSGSVSGSVSGSGSGSGSGTIRFESSRSGSSKKKGSESSKSATSKSELDRMDGMELGDLKKAASKDAEACKKKLAATCAEQRLKCQKSCKSQTTEFYEFCDKDRCTRENEACHKTNAKVCAGNLVIADVVQRLPRSVNCEDSEDIECGMRAMPVSPTIVGSHEAFSAADDQRHRVSSCDTCSQRRAICQTKCQIATLNNQPCPRSYCTQQQQQCDRTCKPSVVAMDISLSSLPGKRIRANVNCPSDAPYCHVKPLQVPRGYLPRRYF